MADPLTIEQKETLKTALADLEVQLRAALTDSEVGASTVELDQTRVGRVSRGDALQQQAMAQAGQRVLQDRLKAVYTARRRMESGDYGYCLECDEPIAYGRLQRQPEVGYCVSCQSAREG